MNKRELFRLLDGRTPQKKLGQNFFLNPTLLNQIITDFEPKSSAVLEIGPGLGALTEVLITYYNQVVAIEIDQSFATHLESHFPKAKFLFSNFLALDNSNIEELFANEFDVIANIPYYITTEIIIKLLSLSKAKNILLLVQEDAIKRIKEEGNNTFSTALINYLCQIEIINHVNRNDFYPIPHVDSAFVQIIKNGNRLSDSFILFLKQLYHNKNKLLLSNLKHHYPHRDFSSIFNDFNISSLARIKSVSIPQLLKIYERISYEN